MPVYKHGKQWRAIVQHNGQRRSAVAKTKADAKRREAELLLELGTTAKTSEVTLGELIDMHVAQSPLADKTREDYEAVRRKLPDWLAAWPVTTVTAHMVDQAYQRLLADGWSEHRVKRLHTILRPAFRRAERWGWLRTNPLLSAEPPSPPESSIHAPDPAIVLKLIAAADNHEDDPSFGTALRVSATTAIRAGELCGLQWGDVDLEAGKLTVRRSITSVKNDPYRVREGGKTGAKGARVIALDPATVALLKAHSTRQKADTMRRPDTNQQPQWIFTSDGVNPWRDDYPTRTFIEIRNKLAVEKGNEGLGIEKVRLHDLRHFVATELLGAGVDIKTVSYRLGHARANTTLNKYASFLPARDQDAASVIAGRLTAKPETATG